MTTSYTFWIHNGTTSAMTAATAAPGPTCTAWPPSVASGSKVVVRVELPAGTPSASTESRVYKVGTGSVTMTWTVGAQKALILGKPVASGAIAFLVSAPQEGAVGEYEADTDATRINTEEDVGTDAYNARSSPKAPKLHPGAWPPAGSGLGTFHVVEELSLSITNKTSTELVRTATNVALEIASLEIKETRTSGADFEPPPTIAAGATVTFRAYSWPKCFAHYAISGEDWTSCFAQIWWDTGGGDAAVVSTSAGKLRLKAAATRAATGGKLTTTVIIQPGPVTIAVAPVATTTSHWVTANPASNASHVGKAATGKGMILGVDVSSYQHMDWEKLSDWVDPEGRRVWFVMVKAFQSPGSVDSSFSRHWRSLAQTRFFRNPYMFAGPVAIKYAPPKPPTPPPGKTGKPATAAKPDPTPPTIYSSTSPLLVGDTIWIPHGQDLTAKIDDQMLQAAADAQWEHFLKGYTSAGGWKLYDLPPCIDFEPVYPSKQNPERDPLRAWTSLTILRTFYVKFRDHFGTPPFIYTFYSCFHDWFAMAHKGMLQHSKYTVWDTNWLGDLMGALIWHSAMPDRATPSREPGGGVPWFKPSGYTGKWFDADHKSATGKSWDVFQFGMAQDYRLPVAAPKGAAPTKPSSPPPAGSRAKMNAAQKKLADDWKAYNAWMATKSEYDEFADPANSPRVNAQALGNRSVAGAEQKLDVNVWNGTLDELVALALRARWSE